MQKRACVWKDHPGVISPWKRRTYAHASILAPPTLGGEMADLEGAKVRLVEALKERTGRYWELMKNWYRRRVR